VISHLEHFRTLLWPQTKQPIVADTDIIFLPCGFFCLSFFFSFFPRLISAITDCAACSSLKIQDTKKSPSVHYRTNLLGYIFATKAHIDNWKKAC